jgi:hypothetical protein
VKIARRILRRARIVVIARSIGIFLLASRALNVSDILWFGPHAGW